MTEVLPPFAFEAAGFLGVALYLGSYAALQFGWIRGSGYTYTLLNLAAASCILFSLLASFNLWSAIIQISWITLSVIGLARYFMLTHKRALTDDETAMLKRWFPLISTADAVQLLRAGEWVDFEDGAEIATQGKVIGALYFQIDGVTEARFDGKRVGAIRNQGVIGELTCFSGEPAGATVRAAGPVRCFRLSTEALRTLVRNNTDFRLTLIESLGTETRAKLTGANLQLTATP